LSGEAAAGARPGRVTFQAVQQPQTDFRFVNIGRYASPQAFRAAIGQPEFRQ
jgi:hypothetical protein